MPILFFACMEDLEAFCAGEKIKTIFMDEKICTNIFHPQKVHYIVFSGVIPDRNSLEDHVFVCSIRVGDYDMVNGEPCNEINLKKQKDIEIAMKMLITTKRSELVMKGFKVYFGRWEE